MTKRNLLEAATLVESNTDTGLWRVRLINEGRGSSGYYSAELLENYKHAFDNVLSYLNHADDPTERNLMHVVGAVEGETWTERGADGTLGIYANWRPDEDYKRKLEAYSDRIGMSIYISGSGEEINGEFHVQELDVSDPFRSVDVVQVAGRGGRFELTESLRENYDARRSESERTPGTSPAERKDNENMELEKVVEAVEALTAQVTALVADKESAKAQEAQANADAQAVAEALETFESAVKAIDEADLLAPQRESLLSAAKRGEDVAPLIESAKAVKDAALEAIQVNESHGRDFGTRKVESATELGKVFG